MSYSVASSILFIIVKFQESLYSFMLIDTVAFVNVTVEYTYEFAVGSVYNWSITKRFYILASKIHFKNKWEVLDSLYMVRIGMQH